MTSYDKEIMAGKMNGCEEDSDDSMTSCEKEDIAGEMYGCEEDSDEFDDII
jgi:hypothetical protein